MFGPKFSSKVAPVQVFSSNPLPTVLNATSNVISYTANSTWNLYGISNGSVGKILIIKNNSTGGGVIQLVHNNTTAPSGARLNMPSGSTLVMQASDTAEFVYNNTTGQWDYVGFRLTANSPLNLSNQKNLTILTASLSNTGALSNIDYASFSQRIQAAGNTGTAYGVPYYTNTGLTPPILYSNSAFVYDSSLNRFGVGVTQADVLGTIHGVSTVPVTIPPPSSFSATLAASPIINTPTGSSAVKTTPDIAQTFDNGSATTNVGSGYYNPGDVIDYTIRAGYDDGMGTITWSVAVGAVNSITDGGGAFDVNLLWSNYGQNFTTNIWSIARQINSAGFNDYQQVTSIGFVDSGSGWNSGSDTFTTLADDFLADGSRNGTFYYYGKGVNPLSNDMYSPTYDLSAFYDGATYDSYKIYHSGNCSATEVRIVSTFNSDHFDTVTGGSTFSPIQSPSTDVAGNTVTPNTYGYQSDGTFLNRNYDLYSYDSTYGIYSTANTQSVSDPADGLWYYIILSGNTFGTSGKIVIPAGQGLNTTTSFAGILDDGITSFPDGSTSTPDSYLPPALLGQSDGDVQVAAKSLTGTTARYGLYDSTGLLLGYIEGNSSKIKIGSPNSVEIAGKSGYSAYLSYGGVTTLTWDNFGIKVNNTSTSYNAGAEISPLTNAYPALLLKAKAGQTGAVFIQLNDSNTIMAFIGNDGSFTCRQYITIIDHGLSTQVGGRIFNGTADKTVANTTTPTSLLPSSYVGTPTLPSDFLLVGKKIKFTVSGYHSSTGSPNVQIDIKIGSTVIATGNVNSGNGSNDGFKIEAEFVCRTIGASGTVACTGTYAEFNTSAKLVGLVQASTSTIDTTTPQTLDVVLTWGTASAGNTMTAQIFTIEVVN